jgi:FAD/FMN-containing dehydrogenase
MKAVESWGRYPRWPQQAVPLSWPEQLPGLMAGLASSTLAYGNGRSYGDSCLSASGSVVAMRPLRQVLAVDWQQGRIRAGAGMTLDELIALTLPMGWFLAVTPGTRFATLGGCVANDVHGKNHHVRGCFGAHVHEVGLWRSDQGLVQCSAQRTPGLWAATLGGLGLSGIILWVELQLMPVASGQIRVLQQRFGNFDEFLQLTEQDQQHEYGVAWVDGLARGAQLGRGVYLFGDHAAEGRRPVWTGQRGMAPHWRMPVAPPISPVRRLTVQAFNWLYWHRHSAQPEQRVQDWTGYFYPLDHIDHWNRLYGRRGFQQYQCVVPSAAAAPVMRALLARIAQSGQASFLAVLKRCGDQASAGYLSFPREGLSLALDFPQSARLAPLFAWMDDCVHEAGGRLYPAKDAHMSARHFQQAYPDWVRVEAQRDPWLQSRFWQRVTQS